MNSALEFLQRMLVDFFFLRGKIGLSLVILVVFVLVIVLGVRIINVDMSACCNGFSARGRT